MDILQKYARQLDFEPHAAEVAQWVEEEGEGGLVRVNPVRQRTQDEERRGRTSGMRQASTQRKGWRVVK